jgi:DNA-directed RNA polymerase subunit M/transcription elongation factor TFIIS
MALPKLNTAPLYELAVPSTGQKVSFRPYLVKEEKVLMMAFESGDQKQALKAIVSTIDACVQEKLAVRDLATFDVEYMFTQIRSKSAGEKATVMLKCKECGTQHEYSVDLSTISVDIPDDSGLIELTDNITIEMRYPPYSSLMDSNLNADQMELGLAMVVSSVSAIIVTNGLEEERIDAKEVSKKEIYDFIESMTSGQFERVTQYIGDLPAMKHNAKFTCLNCDTENDMELKGISDFLS